MIFNDIGVTWKYSISQFRWTELKTVLLVTLKSFIGSIKLIFKYFWWLIAVYSIAILSAEMNILSNPYLVLSARFISMGSSFFLAYVYYLSVRPSLERKDLDYYFGSLRFIHNFLIILVIMFSLLGILLSISTGFIITYPVMSIVSLAIMVITFITAMLASFSLAGIFLILGLIFYPTVSYFSVLMFLLGLLVGIAASYSILFFLDSDKKLNSTFVSMIRGFKAVFYFLPISLLFLLVAGSYMILAIPISQFLIKNPNLMMIVPILGLVLGQLLYLFSLCFLTSYYVKIKHSYGKLFFQ